MADEVVTADVKPGNTEHVVKLITEPVKIDPQTDDGFDEQKFTGLYQRFAPQIEKTLGIDKLKTDFAAAIEREASKDMENAKLKAQTAYGFSDEELAEIPGETAAAFAASAAAAGKYKLAAGESAKQIQEAQSRGILPSELGGVNSPDVPKEGTPEYGIYLIRKAQGLVK